MSTMNEINPSNHISEVSALKRFGQGIMRFFEEVGTARAAAHLAERGYHEEAKRLILRHKEDRLSA